MRSKIFLKRLVYLSATIVLVGTIVSCLETSPLESAFSPATTVESSSVLVSSSSLVVSSSSLSSSVVNLSSVIVESSSSVSGNSSSEISNSSTSLDISSSSTGVSSESSSSSQAISSSSASLPLPKSLVFTLIYNGPVYAGTFYASNATKPKTDYVFWIETADSVYVKTLSINKGILSGKHANMENHLPQWLSKSHVIVKALDANGIMADSIWLDGISGASVAFSTALVLNTVTARWDFTDSLNTPVHTGRYRFCSEVANIDKEGLPTDVPVPSITSIAEHSCGNFDYDGTKNAASAISTSHILSFAAVVE